MALIYFVISFQTFLSFLSFDVTFGKWEAENPVTTANN